MPTLCVCGEGGGSGKQGHNLFNDALNTFYLRLYGVGNMVKDHSDSDRGNQLPPHGLLFPISSKGYFICTIPQTGYHIPRPFVAPVVEHWLEREIAGQDRCVTPPKKPTTKKNKQTIKKPKKKTHPLFSH